MNLKWCKRFLSISEPSSVTESQREIMETYVIIVLLACVFTVLMGINLLICTCSGKKKETASTGPAEKPNNQRSRAITSNGGDFMIYPAAASLPTVSDSGHHGGHHGGGGCGGGGHHGGGGGCGGGGGGDT